MIALRLDGDALTAELAGFAEHLQRPSGLARVLGLELRNRLKSHFIAKDKAEPNQLRGERTHYWRAVSQSVSQDPDVAADGRSVSVSITHPTFAQKLYGGVIVPKEKKFLALPASPQAHGVATKDFEAKTGRTLFVLRLGGTKSNSFRSLLLASRVAGGVQVEYVLRRSVTQKPTPGALPPTPELEAALRDRAQSWADNQKPGGPQ